MRATRVAPAPARLWRFAGLVVLACLAGCGDRLPRRTSVVLVVIDTLRRDHLSVYGYERPTSPGLQRLATESSVFDRCLAPSSWTKPSTVSLLSGLYPAAHGAQRDRAASESIELLSEVLQRHGYATAAFSANPHVSSAAGLDQGFEVFESHAGDGAPGAIRVSDYPDVAHLLEQGRQWLVDRHEPFLLYLHVMNVHGPYRAPARFAQRFASSPSASFSFRNPLWLDIAQRGLVARRAEVTEAHLNDLHARYDGAVAYTDAVLAEFVGALRADGVLDDALLVVTSDHGEELFEHGGFGHRRTLYGEVIEVPLLIRPPGGKGHAAGRRVSDPVSLVDVPATVLDWLGLLAPGAAGGFGNGRSLVPAMLGRGEAPPARPILAQLDDASVGYLLEEWPYRLLAIERDYAGREDRVELFDIEADPAERVDLSTAPEQRARTVRLHALARAWQERLAGGARSGSVVEFDEATRRQLEALGYGR